ncbi:MAG: lactonase family protein [Tepidisphaeraceae bacterium]
MRMFVGTYTNKGTSRGIYALDLDPESGQFAEPQLAIETPNPSFLAMNTLGDRLYAACDPGTFDGKKGGGVAGFRIDRATRALTAINSRPTAGGNCHIDLTPDGKYVTAADYGGAVVSLLPLRADGEIEPELARVQHSGKGPNKERQEKAHAHCGTTDPSGRYVIACDLGTDEVYVYRIDGGLKQHFVHKTKPGTGPRHVTFSRDRRFVYLVNELDNTVDTLKWDAEAGTLAHAGRVSTLPEAWKGFTKAAEIAVHPNGQFVFASNRGCETIARFHVDRDIGLLDAVGHTDVLGKGCRHFAIDPTGRYLVAANEESDNVVAFKIHAETGDLTPTGSQAKIGRPVCVCFTLP